MSYLRYLCLFAHSFFQHILRCVFVLFFFVVLLPVSLDCSFVLPFWYSLTFIYVETCKYLQIITYIRR